MAQPGEGGDIEGDLTGETVGIQSGEFPTGPKAGVVDHKVDRICRGGNSLCDLGYSIFGTEVSHEHLRTRISSRNFTQAFFTPSNEDTGHACGTQDVRKLCSDPTGSPSDQSSCERVLTRTTHQISGSGCQPRSSEHWLG